MMKISVEPKRMRKSSKILNAHAVDELKKNRNIAWWMNLEEDAPPAPSSSTIVIHTTTSNVVLAQGLMKTGWPSRPQIMLRLENSMLEDKRSQMTTTVNQNEMIILRRLMVVEGEPNSQVFLHDSSVRVENFKTTNGPRLPRTEASIFQVMLISAPAMSDLVPPENPLRANHKKRTTVPFLGNNPTIVTNRPQVGECVIRVDLPETGVSKIQQTVDLRKECPRIITNRPKMKARADISLVPLSLKWKMTLLQPILHVDTATAVLTVIEEAKDVAVINMTTLSTKDPKLPIAPKSGTKANMDVKVLN